MRKCLISFGVGLGMVATFFASQAAFASSTQTFVVGGKMTVCTVCGTVVSCM